MAGHTSSPAAHSRAVTKFIKEKYDRVTVTLPMGTKEKILARGESINGYIKRLVMEDMEKNQKSQF